MGYGRENVCTMSSASFYAVPVVDATLSSFVIDVKVLEIVVEIDAAGTEISAEEGSMSRKHSGDVDVALPAERDGQTGLPFMEMGDDGRGRVTSDILECVCSHDQNTDHT